MAENIREIALDTLLALERGMEENISMEKNISTKKTYSHTLIREVLDKYDYLDVRDKAFYKRVTEGAIERCIELDYYLDQFSKTPVRKMRPLIRCLLRMSVYQILYMDAVPDSAVCNEACRLAGKRGLRDLKGYVNGVLRSIARQKGSLPLPDRESEPLKALSVKYSVPEWLAEFWLDEYGWEITATLLEGLMEIHPVSLRFASGMSSLEREELCRRMRARGAELSQSTYLPYVYRLEEPGRGGSIPALPGFAQGLCTVQDVSSALAVEAAGIRKGDCVIDVCAAPGGKSILASEKAGEGRVLARDLTEEKVLLLEENIRRMGAENIEVQRHDAACTDPSLQDRADVLLLDVPCSGLGVMGRKRDIKYHVTKEGMESLRVLQRQIVQACACYVKPGGTLVYSTCTINSGENEEMVRFIVRELGFEPVPLKGVLPDCLLAQKAQIKEALRKAGKEPAGALTEEEAAACIQLLPGYMDSDGFFIARFRRRG